MADNSTDGMPDNGIDPGLAAQMNYLNATQQAHGMIGGANSLTGAPVTPQNNKAPLSNPQALSQYGLSGNAGPSYGLPQQADGIPQSPSTGVSAGASSNGALADLNSIAMQAFNSQPHLQPPDLISQTSPFVKGALANGPLPTTPPLTTGIVPKVIPGMEWMGPIGPDLGGYVAGLQARQQYAINAVNANNSQQKMLQDQDYLKIAQADLGIKDADLAMRQEKFGWDRSDRQTQMINLINMRNAAQSGGLEGVISYLKSADPEQAIQFQAKKLALDNSIMQNKVMQAQTPVDIEKAMVESYGVLGKMGAALLSAPPGQRQAMHEMLLPITSQVLPDMPRNVNDAVPAYMMGAFQASDANQVFKYSQGIIDSDTDIGKLNNLITQYARQGRTMDDPFMRSAVGALGALQTKQQESAANLAYTQAKMGNSKTITDDSKAQTTEKIQENIDKGSQAFNKFMTIQNKAAPWFDILAKNPYDSNAQAALGQVVASGLKEGRIDYRSIQQIMNSSAGYKKVWDEILPSMMTGKPITISPEGIKSLQQGMGAMGESLLAQQQAYEEGVKRRVAGYGEGFNPSNLTWPSRTYNASQNYHSYLPIIQKYQLNKMFQDPSIAVGAAMAIDQGAPADAVVKYTQQQLIKQGVATPQQFQQIQQQMQQQNQLQQRMKQGQAQQMQIATPQGPVYQEQ